MKFEIIIESPAQEDMEEAFLWIAQKSRTHADKWFRELVEAITSLETFPQRCAPAPEDGAFPVEIRQLLYGKKAGTYRILFTIEGKAVHILHIRHCARKYMEP